MGLAKRTSRPEGGPEDRGRNKSPRLRVRAEMKELSGTTLILRNDAHSSQGVQPNTLFISWRDLWLSMGSEGDNDSLSMGLRELSEEISGDFSAKWLL